MSAHRYTLYGYWRSSSSWRVRLALHIKGLTFENVPVHLVRGEQRETDHAARNPMQQVPVLVVDGKPLSQSLAIIGLLDELHPEPALMPATPMLRARARQYAELINAGIQPLQNLAVLQEIESLGGDRLAWGRRVIADGLKALEDKVQATAGQFLVGDQVTVADLCLVPQMYNARRFDVDLSAFPTLVAVDARLSALPAFERAHPDQQPDAQSA
ncbi:MAG: maleylacetoacetate isomerase [Myxococcales bacterium]|nr:maleylacetoacetate isomerase [Myxococcales bacterium]